MKNRIYLALFLLIAIADLYSVSTNVIPREFTKPLVMLSLILYYTQCSLTINRFFVIAMVFAWLGDIFLLKGDNFVFFLAGLSSFLVMQVLYASIFYKDRRKRKLSSQLFALMMAAYAGFLVNYLGKNADLSMIIAIALYAISIALMVIFAFRRKHHGNSYWFILVGALSFLISDSLLGYQKFVTGFRYAGLIIMGTYILGQWLIVEGMRRS